MGWFIKKRGRPKKRHIPMKNGEITSGVCDSVAAANPNAPRKKEETRAVKVKQKVKQTKKSTNWGTGSNLKKMTTAVENWSNDTGNALDCNGEKVSLNVYSILTAIPYKTLVNYVTADANKRYKLGGTVGKKLHWILKRNHFWSMF